MILVIDQGIKACKIFHFLIDYTNKISNVTFLHCAVLLKNLMPSCVIADGLCQDLPYSLKKN